MSEEPAEVTIGAGAADGALVLELSAQGETCALLAVEPAPSLAVRGALRSLATQVSLALDSAALSEEIHRRAGEARFSSLVQNSSDLITVLERATGVRDGTFADGIQ